MPPDPLHLQLACEAERVEGAERVVHVRGEHQHGPVLRAHLVLEEHGGVAVAADGRDAAHRRLHPSHGLHHEHMRIAQRRAAVVPSQDEQPRVVLRRDGRGGVAEAGLGHVAVRRRRRPGQRLCVEHMHIQPAADPPPDEQALVDDAACVARARRRRDACARRLAPLVIVGVEDEELVEQLRLVTSAEDVELALNHVGRVAIAWRRRQAVAVRLHPCQRVGRLLILLGDAAVLVAHGNLAPATPAGRTRAGLPATCALAPKTARG